MATALQCPKCGRKHRLDGPQSQSSFPCEDCGQLLKVPAQFRASADSSPSASAAAPIAAAGTVIGSNVAAAAPSVSPVRPIIGQNQARIETGRTVDTDARNLYAFEEDDFIDDEDDEPSGPGIGARVRLTRSQRRSVMTQPLPWWGRALSWLVALPMAAVLVLVPMRLTRFFSGSYLLGLLSETGLSRFGRLAVAIVACSFVAALIVQTISWFFRRRRIRHLEESAGASIDLALAEELAS